ncbi:Rap1a/Tai family immunity protein [Chelatococcus sp. GCM10030263]|uniref:Rap1a/Tai family immunity protein n=1 Tax=Chelatococcus sp. GCM10030263 TaxID=3273387 RepID=UPI00360E2AE5
MRQLLFSAMFGAVALVAASAHATTALQMRSYCTGVANAERHPNGRVSFPLTFQNGQCWGGFDAIQQVSRVVDGQAKRLFGICSPPQSTLVEMVQIFVAYVDSHPTQENEDWFDVASRALVRAFPCDERGESR